MELSGYFASEFSGYVAAFLFICSKAVPWMKRHSISISWLVPGMLLSVIDGIGLLLLSLPIMEKYRVTGVILMIAITAFTANRYILTKKECVMLKPQFTRVFMWMSGDK